MQLSRRKILDGFPHDLVLEEIPADCDERDIYEVIREGQKVFEEKKYGAFTIVFSEKQLTPFIIGKLSEEKYNRVDAAVYYTLNLPARCYMGIRSNY
ncbi:MAG: hypothetical protein ACO1OC_01655 [Tuberibacillus sp.]